MPWKEARVMDLKVQLIGDWLSERYTVTELAHGYGVSRKTVYKWIDRYQQEGASGLSERSRAPHSQPNKVADEVAERIISLPASVPIPASARRR